MLSQTIERWANSLHDVRVITTDEDTETHAVCDRFANVFTFVSDAFRRNGASFNKGLALAEHMQAFYRPGWWCLFDADILPPPDWRDRTGALESGTLYGAPRWQSGTGELISDIEFPGYFWLFDAEDTHVVRHPGQAFTSWRHAGGYDTDFQARWEDERKVRLPIRLEHLGQLCVNWCGIGNTEALRAMQALRRERGGSYDQEQMWWC